MACVPANDDVGYTGFQPVNPRRNCARHFLDTHYSSDVSFSLPSVRLMPNFPADIAGAERQADSFAAFGL
jgi:hypothetical protein